MGAKVQWLKDGKGWLVSEAGICFRVRKVKKRYSPWRARWYENRKPKTLFASKFPEVKRKVESRIESIRQAGRSAIVLDAPGTRDAVLCLELLNGHVGIRPSDCVRDWLNRRGLTAGSIHLSEAVGEYLKAHQPGSIDSARDRKSRLNRFARDHADLYVSDVTADLVQSWMDTMRGTLGLSAQSVDNYRRALSPFFRFCCRRRWRPDNPIADIDPIALPKKEPAYFTIKEVREILATATARPELDLLGYFSLALFAGVRPDELAREEIEGIGRRRLDWNDINAEDRLIDIPATVSKIGERRLIEGRAGSAREGREFTDPLTKTRVPVGRLLRRNYRDCPSTEPMAL